MSGTADPFNGHIDEFRISHVQRFDGWIETTWNHMSDPGAFAAAEGLRAGRRRAATGFAGATCSVHILGPFTPPSSNLDDFIEGLRERMVAELDAMRAARAALAPDAASASAA